MIKGKESHFNIKNGKMLNINWLFTEINMESFFKKIINWIFYKDNFMDEF